MTLSVLESHSTIASLFKSLSLIFRICGVSLGPSTSAELLDWTRYVCTKSEQPTMTSLTIHLSTLSQRLIWADTASNLNEAWYDSWESATVENRLLVSDPTIRQPGFNLPHHTCFINLLSVLWHYWFGVRKSIRPVISLSDVVLAGLSVWSEVQLICIWFSWCHCHRIISCFIKIQNGLPFWCQLI